MMQARHGQLNAMGWFGSIGTGSPAALQDLQNAGEATYAPFKKDTFGIYVRAQVLLTRKLCNLAFACSHSNESALETAMCT